MLRCKKNCKHICCITVKARIVVLRRVVACHHKLKKNKFFLLQRSIRIQRARRRENLNEFYNWSGKVFGDGLKCYRAVGAVFSILSRRYALLGCRPLLVADSTNLTRFPIQNFFGLRMSPKSIMDCSDIFT